MPKARGGEFIEETRSLIDAYRDRILISGMNTGSTIRKPPSRGTGHVPDAPSLRCLVELTVAVALPHVMDHLIAAEEVGPVAGSISGTVE